MNNNPILPNENEEVAEPTFLQKYRHHAIVAGVALLLLVALVLSIVWLVRATNASYGEVTEDPYFDYEATKPQDYMPDFSLGKFQNVTVGGKGEKIDIVVDQQYVTDYINVNILLAQKEATNKGLAMRSVAIDHADVVYFYVLDLTKNGERVLQDDFGLTYSQLSLTVGGLYYGKDFDDKLIGLVPASTHLEMRYSGTFDATSTLSATYTATVKDEEKPTLSLSGARLEMPALEAGFRDAILAASTAIGKQFEFDYTEDIDGDGDTEEVHYVMTVNAIVDEKAVSITFELPDDYFAESLGEEYTALNGQEVTMRLVLSSSVAYEAYTVDTLLSKDLTTATGDTKEKEEAKAAAKLLGVTDEKKITTKASVLAALRDELLAGLDASIADEKETLESSLIGNAFMKYEFRNLPAAELEAYRKYWVLYYFEAFCDAGLYTEMTFDEFGTNAGLGFVPSEEEGEPKNLDEFILESGEYSIKQNLLISWLYREAGLNTAENEQKIKDGFGEYLSSTYGTDKEEDLKKAGYDLELIYKEYHLQSISEYVNEWMVKNNTVDYEKEIEE
ncbi:MAG: hypothetical protein IJY71_07635 [Clostridia bacterium]|nr:hypothetical protein [Clostridia bacterium]